ncbi:1,4-dihydroxy-6-naphtoate synthase [Rubripirellula tenax]|uniref:1,4-dihydroxy-6-naphtoate synthase n=2 Tax=Rubripirellula tenax TaxID=2528015 RepID=A0A5C6FH09_9BACT|nr:1,4-dihydroxy-6-naphtoate synthase [Rubripirellula tenax]
MMAPTNPSTSSGRIRLGISTCPNDTFAFAGLIDRRVDWRGLQFDIELIDIQQLNDRLFEGDFDVAKTSFHAALLMADRTVVLPSGSALGFGVGPLLLAAESGASPNDGPAVTLCPGRHTTASLLFSLFYRDAEAPKHCVFSDIMPRLKAHQADFGVCIHEGRFTWQAEGLHLVEDLGTRWERETDSPLPLGGIVADRKLGDDVIAKVQAVIRDSLELAMADPSSAMPTMRQHAQEFDDDVLMKHVQLYVNEWTVDLGSVGRSALRRLAQMSEANGIVERAEAGLEVWA